MSHRIKLVIFQGIEEITRNYVNFNTISTKDLRHTIAKLKTILLYLETQKRTLLTFISHKGPHRNPFIIIGDLCVNIIISTFKKSFIIIDDLCVNIISTFKNHFTQVLFSFGHRLKNSLFVFKRHFQ